MRRCVADGKGHGTRHGQAGFQPERDKFCQVRIAGRGLWSSASKELEPA